MRQPSQIDIAQFMSSQARERAINKMIALLIIFFIYSSLYYSVYLYCAY